VASRFADVAVDDVTTWHHGVVARWWANFNTDGPEVDFFGELASAGQPVVDIGCGTGRLLVEWARRGIDVDGVDASSDMIAECRTACDAAGVSPTLLVQPTHRLELARRYSTAVMCGVFGLGSTRDDDATGLRRILDHLLPGGLLAFDLENSEFDVGRWHEFRPRPADITEPPPDERRRGADGDDYALRQRVVELDPASRSAVREIQAWQWHEGVLVAHETHRLVANPYTPTEVVELLGAVGFVDVHVVGGYHGGPPTGDERFSVYLARRPA
jgi:SAM-dependent methyltransferase